MALTQQRFTESGVVKISLAMELRDVLLSKNSYKLGSIKMSMEIYENRL